MSKHKGPRDSVSLQNGGPALTLGPGSEEVRKLIEKGNSKSAVEVAKGLHKRFNSAESEQLAVQAYAARIASLQEHHMDAEAAALTAMVRERYPSASKMLANVAAIAPRSVSLEDLVRPLADPALSREERETIESALRKRLDNLPALANCSALPPNHPLRTGAAALDEAFRAVTSGPVSEEQLLLPGISHRSPLAPWKSLIRAVASFYENDGASAERYVQAIDPESPPARVAPALRALLNGRPAKPLKPAAQVLFTRVGGGSQILRGALDALDRALASGRKSNIITEIRNAVRVCREVAPDLIERLKQHIAIRTFVTELDEERVNGALDGSCLKNAYYWLLFARTTEGPDPGMPIETASIWEQFRVHAIHEGWFPAKGPEEARLYLHMAGLYAGLPAEELQDLQSQFRGFPGYGLEYDDQPREIRAALAGHNPKDQYYAHPELLFEKACAIDPHAQAYMQWMTWAIGDREKPKWKAADHVAESWRRALPSDTRPLLYLMLSAERRDAYHKALGFVEEAERIDPLNPEVRRARLQLLVGIALRHLSQRKTKLAERELVALEGLPQAREGSRPALVSALRWVSSTITGDRRTAQRHLAETAAIAGCEAVGVYLCGIIGALCGLRPEQCGLPQRFSKRREEPLATIIAKASAIADDVKIGVGIPDDFVDEVLLDLERSGGKIDVAHLRTLAEAARSRNQHELVYAVSVAGLARGGPTEARFLLIRAQATPPWESKRRNELLAAAEELARRNRDMELVKAAVDLRRDEGGMFFDMLAGTERRAPISEKELNAILKRERAATKFEPSGPPSLPVWLDEDDDDEDDEDDEIFQDANFNLFGDPLPPTKPKRRYGRNSPF